MTSISRETSPGLFSDSIFKRVKTNSSFLGGGRHFSSDTEFSPPPPPNFLPLGNSTQEDWAEYLILIMKIDKFWRLPSMPPMRASGAYAFYAPLLNTSLSLREKIYLFFCSF